MPNNYVLLEKITVGAAGAASVTFANIPQTGYTDLVVKVSTRGATNSGYSFLSFNGSTTSYSTKALVNNGGTPTSASYTLSGGVVWNSQSAYTASTFASGDIYIPNYTSSNFKSFSIDSTAENNASPISAGLETGLWSNTAAITSITCTPNTGNYAQFSTFYLYGVAKLGTTPAIAPKAAGGDIVMTDGTYWYHAFRSSGTFTPAVALSCDYLVVAGGGGAGAGSYGAGGGGGAGGYLTSTGYSCASGVGLTVTIGAGGAGGTYGPAVSPVSGSNSTFATITSTGGGYGGRNISPTTAANGGSGGGGGYGSTFGLGISGQGNNGGAQTTNSGGGGGGAGGVGGNATSTVAGAGGAGLNTLSTWLNTTGTGVSGYIAGGGGGSVESGTGGAAGSGGGGAGAQGASGLGISGTANTGGGGGSGYNGGSNPTGSGGSGLVIVRYLVA
jgi:hypothetical protein